AQTMTWICYLLSQHPQVEKQLHKELDEVLGGREPTAEDLPRLTYTRMVAQEALRLFPAVMVTNREAAVDTEISGYHIPKGSLLCINLFAANHHPEYWENPEAFIPERFAPENANAPYHHAYLPFGAGPRICIGNHFALLELQLMMAVLMQRY